MVPAFLDLADPLQARPALSSQVHLSPHSMSLSALTSPFCHLQPNECCHVTWNILHHHPFLVLTTSFSTLSLPPGFFPGPQIGLDAKAVSANNILSEPDHTSILADHKLRVEGSFCGVHRYIPNAWQSVGQVRYSCQMLER